METIERLSDAEGRRLAVSELEKNLVVLAGAGTGKTTLLIDRLTLLILGKQIPVERIVALTFTRKAAEELRERLEQRLRRLLKGELSFPLLEEKFPETKSLWVEKAKRALEDIPKAQLGTIHSFAAHLLRLHPMEAGVDPKFREDKGEMFEELFELKWTQWLLEELKEGAPRSRAWTEVLSQAGLSDLRAFAAELANSEIQPDMLNGNDGISAMAKSAGDEVERLLRENPISVRARAFGPGMKALREIFAQVAAGQTVSPSLLDLIKTVGDPPKGWEDHAPLLKEYKRRAKALASVDEKLLRNATELLFPFIRLLRRELRRRGVISFDGLLLFARNLLQDNIAVREALKKKFDCFLVDEFQDTDPLQGEILFYLSEVAGGRAKTWRDVSLSPGRLFVVGDPKQSIYRFRGADIAAFEEFERHMTSQGALKVDLGDNFRSHAPLLDLANHVFPLIMTPEPYLQPPYYPLRAVKEEAAPPPDIFVLEAGTSHLPADDHRSAEAEAIADWILKSGRPLREVALLFRSAHAFSPYLSVFRRRGIRYLAEGEKFFYRTSEVNDFVNLLGCLADPEDALSLAGVLRSPSGGLTDEEILALKNADSLDYRRAPRALKEKIGPLYQKLNELSQQADTLPLPDLIQAIFQQTWILELAFQSSSGEQAAANVEKAARLAAEWSDNTPLTLKTFVRRFQRYREDEKEEGENPLADINVNAVKVMTIHKAKGLEFPVVFLPNLSAPSKGKFSEAVLLRDWRTGRIGLRLPSARKTNSAMATLEEDLLKREEAEEVRVFYVAATRAKERLICVLRTPEMRRAVFSDYLRRAGLFPTDGSGGETSSPVAHTVLRSSAASLLESAYPSREKKTLSKEWDANRLAALFFERMNKEADQQDTPLFLSPSYLMRKEKPELIENEKGIPLENDDQEQNVRARAIQIGLLCHKVLEEWDYAVSAKKVPLQIKAGLERAGRLFGLIPDDPAAKDIARECTDILSAFFSGDAYLRLAESTIIGREIPFFYPAKDPQVMRGVIDLLYEKEGKWIVADFKTNRVNEKSLEQTVKHYQQQAAAYRAAIQKSLGREAGFELLFLRNGLSVPVF